MGFFIVFEKTAYKRSNRCVRRKNMGYEVFDDRISFAEMELLNLITVTLLISWV